MEGNRHHLADPSHRRRLGRPGGGRRGGRRARRGPLVAVSPRERGEPHQRGRRSAGRRLGGHACDARGVHGVGAAHGRRVPAPRRRRADRLGLSPQPARHRRVRRREPGAAAARRPDRDRAPARHRPHPAGSPARPGRDRQELDGRTGGSARVRPLRRPGRHRRRRRRPRRGPRRSHRRGRSRRAGRPAPGRLRRPARARPRHRARRAGRGDVRVRPPPVAKRRRPRGAPPDRPRDRIPGAGHARDRHQRRPVAADVLAKVLSLRPARIASTAEAALVAVDGDIRTTPAWERVVRR